MLRLGYSVRTHPIITWDERDVLAMTNILGADNAVEQQCPYNPAILRAAARKTNVRLSKRAREALDRAEAERRQAKQLKALEDVDPIFKVERKAFAHQRVALKWLRHTDLSGYLVADKTGVGKTLVALFWAFLVVKAERILIITKNIAKEQWEEAIRHFIGKKVLGHKIPITIVEGKIPEQVALAQKKRGVVIGHWESLAHAGKGYRKRDWDCIILDEGQYMANRKALRTRVVFRLKSDHKMVMTAHPFSNDPAEIFPLLKFLYPHVYSAYWRFFHMHVKASPKAFGGFEIEGARRPKLLAWEIEPFTIMRTKQQVFKSLPEITRKAVYLHLTKRGESEYGKLKRQFFAEIAGLDDDKKIIPIINDLARLTRLRQYLIDPGLIGGRERPIKYDAVLELMDEVVDPLVVFSEYKKAVLRLGSFLTKKKQRVGYITGGMKKGQIGVVKKNFLRGKYNALLVVAKAGDTALNLGKYGYLAHLDLPWNPRGLEQREGRVDRPEEKTGKLVPTTGYHIVIRNSYEEKMQKRLEKKHNTFSKVFTVADLRDLFE